MNLGDNIWISIVVVLAEVIYILLVAVVVLAVLYRRQRRRIRGLQAEGVAPAEDVEAFSAFLHEAVKRLVHRFRKGWQGAPAELHRLAHIDDTGDPELVCLQMRYALLQSQLTSLEAPPEAYWRTHQESVERDIRLWDRVEKAITTAMRASRAESSRERSHTETASLPDSGSNDPWAAHNQAVEVQRLQERIGALEGYRERFNEMHSANVVERRANAEMRHALRAEFGDEGALGRRLDEHLAHYEHSRQPLDEYMDRGDIAPFEARPAAGVQRPTRPHSLRRRDQLIEQSTERMDTEYRRIVNSLDQQRTVIRELRTQLESSEQEKEQQKREYLARIAKLERQIQESEQSLTLFQNENYRNRRQIRKLMSQAEAYENQRQAISSLEETVDRFAAQAITMQQRISELERERDEAEANALRSEGDTTEEEHDDER